MSDDYVTASAEPASAPSLPVPVAGRPRTAPGYGIDPSATDGMLPWSVVADQLMAARNYWLATTRPDGRPHVMPIWALWMDGTIAFGTDPSSVKGRNLAVRADAVVHLESGDDVVVVEGVVESVDDPATVARFVAEYAVKYGITLDLVAMGAGVQALRPRVVLAWREQAFPASAVRFAFP